MSIEAIAYVKTLDLGKSESPGARLMLYVIAENTFNDSGLCRVGQDELKYQTRLPLRTLQRHYRTLCGGTEDKPKFIEVKARGSRNGRLPDDISIPGFLDWLKSQRDKKPAKGGASSPSLHEQPAKLADSATRHNGGKRNPPDSRNSQLSNLPIVAGIYKDNRTSNRTRGAQSRAQVPINDLKSETAAVAAKRSPVVESQNKPARYTFRRGSEEFAAWRAFFVDCGNVLAVTSMDLDGYINTYERLPPKNNAGARAYRVPNVSNAVLA